ncbi:MAG: flagellar protein FhlB [Rhodospirillaceae bacterium]|jgi:flagellar biosynthesis protein|uniref:EscU/YscU/HrcU family type III secretion system export apparatus switch protein n=1 Tax=unclassified Hwanghaeella TaxID=2605944 RepID=UPI000C4001A2|nr:flagellar protein FhlB [Rhodospirillales bacterium]MAX47246.1 flagellar protein FhlB [Rhodospirillaceae bacterium]|tara:strand:+ start:927 stop:1274 length:348 start_codon:yes stop_codon:yes gene_type:complete
MARSSTPTDQTAHDGADSQNQKGQKKNAVALTYKPNDADSAPVVSASGEGYLAERIIELALASGIPVQSDSDLVELLSATEVGEEIPIEAFIAVAEILRYVYALNGQSAPVPPLP